jgi:SAM-dependent methyltransferase
VSTKRTKTLLNALADRPISSRYSREAYDVFDSGERERFLDQQGRPRDPEQLQWELLYRIEPELYARLIAGEHLHPQVLGFLPAWTDRVLEIGAGTGRLTVNLAPRCGRITAVEPAAPLRNLLVARLGERAFSNVDVVRGFFDAIPVAESSCDLVVSCSTFVPSALADPEACLNSIESRCAPNGMIAFVWPSHVDWLQAHGYEYVAFEGAMEVTFKSLEEALTLARVFYPNAVDAIAAGGSRFIDYEILGINPPRDVCWKRK